MVVPVVVSSAQLGLLYSIRVGVKVRVRARVRVRVGVRVRVEVRARVSRACGGPALSRRPSRVRLVRV